MSSDAAPTNHDKEIEFREIPILKGPKAGSRASGKGKLMITIFHLGEVPFRSVTAAEVAHRKEKEK